MRNLFGILTVGLFLAFPVLAGDGGAFFTGKNLDGWEGLPGLWKAEDGVLTGKVEKIGHNTFLCSKKKYGDFEMNFEVKLVNGNSGIQIRSKIDDEKKFIVAGPQADIGAGYWGSLYGERFGGMMKQADGKLINKVVKNGEFNNYSIKAVGKHITIKVNGETMVDQDFPKAPDEGIIAFQLHAPGPMEVVFRKIEFKELTK